jgi:hypothetical protein
MDKVIRLIIIAILAGSCAVESPMVNTSDYKVIESHLKAITKTDGYRNYQNTDVLNKVADYIHGVYADFCDTAYFQEYYVGETQYKNVIGVINPEIEERLIIGAHYDVAGDQEGADDNASGVVGLLELARLLQNSDLKYRIELVAYTLEEPPFFRTKQMGSYIHAKSLYDTHAKVKGMICLEMIGYFADGPNTQEYPLPHKKIVYGDEGNYILIVQNFEGGGFSKSIKSSMKKADLIETKSIKLPGSVTGVDFSDHLNYWDFGYKAVMITNTAFYRNKNYHEETDKMETLDIKRMSSVIDEVYYAVIHL